MAIGRRKEVVRARATARPTRAPARTARHTRAARAARATPLPRSPPAAGRRRPPAQPRDVAHAAWPARPAAGGCRRRGRCAPRAPRAPSRGTARLGRSCWSPRAPIDRPQTQAGARAARPAARPDEPVAPALGRGHDGSTARVPGHVRLALRLLEVAGRERRHERRELVQPDLLVREGVAPVPADGPQGREVGRLEERRQDVDEDLPRHARGQLRRHQLLGLRRPGGRPEKGLRSRDAK